MQESHLYSESHKQWPRGTWMPMFYVGLKPVCCVAPDSTRGGIFHFCLLGNSLSSLSIFLPVLSAEIQEVNEPS